METQRKTYEELTITDDFMFCKVMTNNPELCRHLLELVLDIPIRKVEISEEQKQINLRYDAKSVRLDVYVEDGNNTVYDVDMQVLKDHIPKRMRYYQGMIDLNMLKKGVKYKDLKKSYVIFLCEFDLESNGKNLPLYHFENLCREDPSIRLGDDACKVYVNAAGNRQNLSANLSAFLDYLMHKKPSDDFTRSLEEEVLLARKHQDWSVEYMTLQMKYDQEREEGRAEGRAEGEARGRAEGQTLFARLIQRLIADGKTEEIQKVADDPAYRQKCMEHYGLLPAN